MTMDESPPGGDDNERRKVIEELMVNLPFIRSLNTGYRFVMNKQSRKVHLTVSSCIPAVSMRRERRFYTDLVPPDGQLCKFCEDQLVRHREERVRDDSR